MSVHLAIIVGSVRRGRRAPSVARWVYERVSADPRFTVEVLDLVDWQLPTDLSGGTGVDAFANRIAEADGFIMVTAEYNHGYSAALKTAIDSVKRPWAAKPVGFVSYGGWAGGVRAVEQLRQVVAEVHMADVRQAVAIRDIGTDDVRVNDRSAEADHLDTMLDQLDWWAQTLSPARAERPYPAGRKRKR